MCVCVCVCVCAQVDVTLPYSAGDFLDDIHKAGELVGEAEYTDTGVCVCVCVCARIDTQACTQSQHVCTTAIRHVVPLQCVCICMCVCVCVQAFT